MVVKLVADHCGYPTDEMHELLAFKFLRIDDDPITGAPRRRRTPATNTQEFENYLEQIRIFAATELDVMIPLPNEVEAA